MSLTDADVLHVASLARLGLTEEEVSQLQTELSSILDHIAVLQRIDTSAISPTAQVNNLRNVLREDVVTPSLARDHALANAPRQQDGFIEVRAVLGEDEGETA